MHVRAALFDVDGVILRGKGLNLFARYLVARRQVRPSLAVRGAVYAVGHRLGWLDGAAVLRGVAVRYLAGRSAADFAAFARDWFALEGSGAIYPEARELAAAHQRAGIPVALLSGGMEFVVAEIARALVVDRWVAVTPEVQDGCFTGRLLEPLCIDRGKLEWARIVARELGVELADCRFYSDDFGDLALLDAVGEPVVVNPDPRLRRAAIERGWPIREFAPALADEAQQITAP
jgi:putative phosphoserine phosphatase/1-acylglycerol-3-phosphate O-acyltransferase